MKLPRLSTLVLCSEQTENTKAFYEAIGFSFEWNQFDDSPGYCSTNLGRQGLLDLEIRSHEFCTRLSGGAEFTCGNAIALSFQIASLEKTIRALEHIGVTAKRGVPSGQARACMAHDPDGRAVRLVENTS